MGTCMLIIIFFVDYLHSFFDLANRDLISLASFAQSVFLQLSSLFRTVELYKLGMILILLNSFDSESILNPMCM